MGSGFDLLVQPFKRWLRGRLKKVKRDNIDDLAKKIIDDKRLPPTGSRLLYLDHLRTKEEYGLEEIAVFEDAWEEMRESQS